MTARLSASFMRVLATKGGAKVHKRPAKGKARIAAALEREPRREASCAIVELPLPPSKNALNDWTPRGMANSVAYLAWKTQAMLAIRRQKTPSVRGPYTLRLIIGRESRLDLGNHEVAASDLLQHARIIDNDRLCERIVIDWRDAPGMTAIVVSAGLKATEIAA